MPAKRLTPLRAHVTAACIAEFAFLNPIERRRIRGVHFGCYCHSPVISMLCRQTSEMKTDKCSTFGTFPTSVETKRWATPAEVRLLGVRLPGVRLPGVRLPQVATLGDPGWGQTTPAGVRLPLGQTTPGSPRWAQCLNALFRHTEDDVTIHRDLSEKSQWGFVSSSLNPADEASSGHGRRTKHHRLGDTLSGPHFLRSPFRVPFQPVDPEPRLDTFVIGAPGCSRPEWESGVGGWDIRKGDRKRGRERGPPRGGLDEDPFDWSEQND
ncbi:unnamed protein product [Lota lota]